jgi:anti-sigma regulatory factor (Ser/Thr protein kinase)
MDEERWRQAFPVDAGSAGAARRWAVDVLRLQGEAASEVALLVSELVTNALMHAGLPSDGCVILDALSEADAVRIEVCDEGGRFGKRSAAWPREDGGRGLQLVAALSSAWGVRHNGVTRVWFEYPVRESGTTA